MPFCSPLFSIKMKGVYPASETFAAIIGKSRSINNIFSEEF